MCFDQTSWPKNIRLLGQQLFLQPHETRKRTFGVRKTHRWQPYTRPDYMKTPHSSLFGYQRKGVKWVNKKTRKNEAEQDGVVLQVSVGAGKTIMSLKSAELRGWHALFVCPPNSGRHILKEVSKHYGTTISATILTQWPTKWPDLAIMSYHTITSLKQEDVVARPKVFRTCIVDEVQDAVSQKQLHHKIQHVLHADCFIGLTGSYKLKDMYDILAMLHTLTTKPQKHVFRCWHPPDFVREQRFLFMTGAARQEYESLKKQVAAETQRLKRHALLKRTWKLLSLDKVEHVAQFLCAIPPTYKIVVVSQYSETIQALLRKLPSTFTKKMVVMDVTEKDMAKREQCLNVFLQMDGCKCLLANMGLIRVTVDLGIADVIVVIDQPYFAKDKFQLEGRLHRCGQRPKHLPISHIVDIVIKESSDAVLFRTNGGILPVDDKTCVQDHTHLIVKDIAEEDKPNSKGEQPSSKGRKNDRFDEVVERKSKKAVRKPC